jgi:hypothetical protein
MGFSQSVDGKLVDADLCWHCCVCHVLSRSQGLRTNLPGIAKPMPQKQNPPKGGFIESR